MGQPLTVTGMLLFARALEVAGQIEDAKQRAEALQALQEVVSTMAQAEQWEAATQKEAFKRLVPPCAHYPEAAYRMCGLLARVYPEKARDIAELLARY